MIFAANRISSPEKHENEAWLIADATSVPHIPEAVGVCGRTNGKPVAIIGVDTSRQYARVTKCSGNNQTTRVTIKRPG